MMRSSAAYILLGLIVPCISMAQSGPYHPAATVPGTNAIGYQSAFVVDWASGVEVDRGPVVIENSGGPLATSGVKNMALGQSDGAIVSLGDGGSATLTFDEFIVDRPGYDLAVFENGFYYPGDDAYFLELATVAVSSDGINFFTFPPHSLTDTSQQVGSFQTMDPTYINNLAGKYEGGQGTPFDLAELAGIPELDIQAVTHVRVTDVVGTINRNWATLDTAGNPINDPYPTDFASSGFDLDAVAIVNENVGLQERRRPEWLTIYDANQQLVVQSDIAVDIKVFSALGQLCIQDRVQVGSYAIPHALNPGVYILHVAYNGGVYSTTCVVQ